MPRLKHRSAQMFLLFLQIYPHLLQFTYKVNLKTKTHRKFTPKLRKFTQALLAMLVTLRMSPACEWPAKVNYNAFT